MAVLGTCLAALIGGLALTAPAAFGGEACPNADRRVEQVSTLPDCRAYELVTPVNKDSGEPVVVHGGFFANPGMSGIPGVRAAADGERMAWDSEYSLPGSPAPGVDYLSTRGPDGWLSENVIPRQSVESGLLCPNLVGIVAWSADLLKGVLADGDAQEGANSFHDQGFECGHDEPRLVAGEPEGFQSLFVRDSATHVYELVNVTPANAPRPQPKEASQDYYPANFLASSRDLSHIVFEEELPLTEQAERLTPQVEDACKQHAAACWEGHDAVYEWSKGRLPAVHLVSVLPDGTPIQGALASATRNATRAFGPSEPSNVANFRHAVSANGSRVFFVAGGNLYVRESGDQAQSPLGPKGECVDSSKACTIQIDAPQGGPGAGGGGKFVAANAEGTKVFFTDEASAALTASTVAGSGVNLYEYDLPAEGGRAGRLLDLTSGTTAAVLGISGLSEDGSYLYFVAEAALTGNQQNSSGARAEAGQPNLYLLHEATTTFVATLDINADSCDWALNAGCESGGFSGLPGLTARVSSNGLFVGFNSINPLTGYNNTDSVTTKADGEIFLYDAAASRLSCVSCNPAGQASGSGAVIRWTAPPDTNAELRNAYPQRNVTDAGQVFFETAEALLPRDTNGQRDVYEYERGGLYLISSGTGEAASFFLDATPSGNDVFLATTQPLLRRDTDTAYDIYDARGGGGFAEPPGPVPSCGTGEGCRGSAPGAPVFPAPTSATFVGVGNLFTATPTGGTGSNRSGKHKHKIKKKCVAKNKKRCAKSRRTKKSTRASRVVRARHRGAR